MTGGGKASGVWIGVAVAVVVGSAGLSAFSIFGSELTATEDPPPRVSSLLAEPTAIRALVEAKLDERWLPLARKLTIERNTAELLVEDAEGLARRYTLYADGRVLRRGGAQRTAAEPFGLRELALERLPDMLEEARRVSGHGPRHVVVGRDEEGTLLWRVVLAGGGADVYFAADGTHVADPDAP